MKFHCIKDKKLSKKYEAPNVILENRAELSRKGIDHGIAEAFLRFKSKKEKNPE